MAWFGRDKLAKASEEFAETLKVVDNIRTLQRAQTEMAEAIRRIADGVQSLEVEFRALKAEIRAETLRETQGIVNAVQGGFYQKLQDIAVDVAVLRRDVRESQGQSPLPRVSAPPGDGVNSLPES